MPYIKGGAHSLLFILYMVTGKVFEPRSQRTYPVSVRPQSSWGQFSLIFIAIIFQPLSSSLRDILCHRDRWAKSPPHSPFPMGHLPAQPQARREPCKHSHWAPATAMNVVLQVLPHPAPETGQIRIVAGVGSKALPRGGAAVGRGERRPSRP